MEEFVLKLGDWYTAGMLVVPLTLVGFALKFGKAYRDDKANNGLALGVAVILVGAAAGAAWALIPPYLAARDTCKKIVASEEVRGTFAGLNPDYWKDDCAALLRW
jgi:hypothetical protein